MRWRALSVSPYQTDAPSLSNCAGWTLKRFFCRGRLPKLCSYTSLALGLMSNAATTSAEGHGNLTVCG
jgi:hypothetical protein